MAHLATQINPSIVADQPAGGSGFDRRLSRPVLALTGIEVLVLLGASGGLLFLPELTRELWPWTLAPFNTRFLGAVYASAMLSVAAVLRLGRWRAGWPGVLAIGLFTGIVLAVSIAYRERFLVERWATAVWWFLYVALPASAIYQLATNGLPPRAGVIGWSAATARRLTAAVAWGSLLYGLLLLVLPAVGTAWPWSLDAFHARLYSAAFVTGGVGILAVIRFGDATARAIAGCSQLAFAMLAIGGLWWVDRGVHKIDWAAPKVWSWLAGFALLAAVGGLLITSVRWRRVA